MCKKILLLALLAVGGLWAYRHVDWDSVRCKKNDSLEKQIRRERERLPELDAEIKRLISQVAAREVELKQLEKEITETEKQLEQARQAMTARDAELRGDGTLADGALVKDDSKTGPERQRALKELNRLADCVERLDATLKARKEQREAFKDALNASHEELVAYKNERHGLETELAQLDAMVAQMRSEEIKTRVHFDKSRLAEATKRIEQLRTRAEVRQKERELQVKYLGTPGQPTPPKSEKDVLERVKKLAGK